ncbi:hypothetical protein RSAG8_05405, partial [Rhizoctonia solani AG-8 WAC10335]
MNLYNEFDDDVYDDSPIDCSRYMRTHRRRKRATLVAMLIVLAYMAKKQKIAARRSRCRFLKRAELMPAPRTESPWQAIFRSREDRAFITTMGMNVATFDFILDHGFRATWIAHTIPREDVNPQGLTCPGRRSLDAEGALGLLLHYLSGTMGETTLQQVFALVPSVIAHYIKFALGIMLAVLRYLPDGKITWPNAEKMREYSDAIHSRHPAITGAFGFLDGLSLPVSTSSDPAIKKATYNGWLHAHKISNILVFAPDGTIIAAKINAPGSWHDSRVATHIYKNLIERTDEGFFLIADTAFPRNGHQISSKIKTPFKTNHRFPDGTTREAATNAMEYSHAITSARQAAEWGMRALQGSFARLRMPLDINDSAGRKVLIETCIRLHNLRTRRIAINQITTVYSRHMQQWGSNEEDFFERLHATLFPEIRRADRINQFYRQLRYI